MDICALLFPWLHHPIAVIPQMYETPIGVWQW